MRANARARARTRLEPSARRWAFGPAWLGLAIGTIRAIVPVSPSFELGKRQRLTCARIRSHTGAGLKGVGPSLGELRK